MNTFQQTGSGMVAEADSQSSEPPGQLRYLRYNPDGSGGPGPKYLHTEDLLDRHGGNGLDKFVVNLVERLIGIAEVNEICLRAGTPFPPSVEMIEHLFRELSISWRVTNPEKFDELGDGPVIFVANHPYGMADAFAMNNMLEKYRPNFRLFANSFLTMADSISHKLLFVDPFMAEKSRGMNRRSMVAALKHVRDGGDLAIFPGRICSNLSWGSTTVQDGEWTNQVRVFAEAGQASIVPVHVPGRNSWRFQLAGLVHPRLRTLRILREFLRGGMNFSFTLGDPVPASSLIKASRSVAPGNLMRAITYATNPAHASPRKPARPVPVRVGGDAAVQDPAIRPRPLGETVVSLPRLVSHGCFDVHDAARGLPEGLEDAVAKVRFDAYSGEAAVAGPRDMIDRFDPVYSHLVLWDREAGRVAGTYRYVVPSRVEGGIQANDLVTASIFDLRGRFRSILPRSMELGRAAIHPDYQKSYAPLMVMWRGIMEVLAADSSIKYLFGPLTISQAFSPLSRHLLKHFMETRLGWPEFSGAAVPRHPFDVKIAPEINLSSLTAKADNLVDLGSIIEAVEGGRRKLPVLYRQYSNFGLRCIATGEWPELDHAMASLAVLDLASAKRDFISRYLDKDSVERFFESR